MGIESFYIMRHELLLVLIALIILVFEIFKTKENATIINALTILLFLANVIIGFYQPRQAVCSVECTVQN